MKKKFTAIGLVLCIALTAGCGSTGNNAQTAKPAGSASNSTTTEKPKEPVKLKVFVFTNDGELRKVADAYKVANPNVMVDVEMIGNDYGSVLQTKLNAGDIPDIFQTQAYGTNQLYKDFILDLTDEEFMKDIEDNAKVGATMNGRVYGVPLSIQAYGFIYNKKVFEDAGITELPKTYSQLEETAKKIQSKGIIPFANDYKEWWVFKHILTQNLAADEGDYAKTAQEVTEGKAQFGKLKYDAKVLDLLDMTLKYGSPKPLATDFTTGVGMVAEGKAAMIHQGTWAEATILKVNPNAKIGFIPEPVGEDPSKAKLMTDASVLMRISKSSKNMVEAKKFITFMNNWIKENGIGTDIPTVKNAKVPEAQLAKETVQYLKDKMTYPWVQGYWPAGFDEQLGQIFQAYVDSKKTKEQVFDEMNKQWIKLAKAAN